MNVSKNILIAFILNITFSIIELIGGMLTNSVAIMSDAIHDFGDALSIGISFILEKKSHSKPNDEYTYGYARFSILGALITTIILTIGSVLVIVGAIFRIKNPVIINYDGMIILAILGVIINFGASYFTKGGNSINQKAVNLHMLEDVFGWIIVLVGAILMKFTDIRIIDSVMSMGVALFILVNALKNFKEILDLFLVKKPSCLSIEEIKNYLIKIEGVVDVHHIHLWSLDGVNNYATMHVKINKKDESKIKREVRNELFNHDIGHVTIEIEKENECCSDMKCEPEKNVKSHSHHH